MTQKNQKTINFIKKNAYYLIFIAVLAVLTFITVALVISSNQGSQTANGDNVIQDNEQKPDDSEKEPTNPNEQNPVVSVVVFDMPIKNATILKDYVADGVVYNQTLGLYSGHKAIDFSAPEGSVVFACYDGVIENITTSKLEGTTLTLDHGNGLKTVYNNIEVNEELSIGDSVKKGSELGKVSNNNRTEYKDGAHLHFEVIENGSKIDPNKYLLTEEK